MRKRIRKLWLIFLKLFDEPGIPISMNRQERRTRASVAKKQVNKRGLRREQKNKQL